MWYYAQSGQQQGPVSDEQIQRMAQDGSLRKEDLVWREGMADWQPAGEVSGLQLSSEPSSVLPPPGPSSPYAPPRYQGPPAAGQYGVPPPGYPPAGADIPDYLAASIAVTLLCCMPGGVAAIVYASKASSAKRVGDFETARQAAQQAKTWIIVSVVVGLLLSVGYVIAIVGGQLAQK